MALVARSIGKRFPSVTYNTYRGHPWPGWDGRSIDVWGKDGRGDPIPLQLGHEVLRHVWNLDFGPWLRHYIYLRTLWTSFGGESVWHARDHSGNLRHLHLTYW